MKDPTAKAWLATGVFSLAGFVSFFAYAPLSSYLLPHLIFYTVLVVNTFFSIRFFSRIIPKSTSQILIDSVLVLLYLALAFSMGQPVLFALLSLCLFVIASAKYALLLFVIPQTHVLKRKILIDLIGTLACALFLGVTIAGHAFLGAWAATLSFTFGNVYLLFIRPMYRP